MLTWHRPRDADIRTFLRAQPPDSFSYPEVGATRAAPPRGYNIDHHCTRLGSGGGAFNRAVAALRRWEMFNINWVSLCWSDAQIDTGTTVGILVPLGPMWALSACRIVYTIDDEEDGVRRYGF